MDQPEHLDCVKSEDWAPIFAETEQPPLPQIQMVYSLSDAQGSEACQVNSAGPSPSKEQISLLAETVLQIVQAIKPDPQPVPNSHNDSSVSSKPLNVKQQILEPPPSPSPGDKVDWTKVAIKKEKVDVDDLCGTVKQETPVKHEEFDVKEEDEEETVRRNFECTECQSDFYQECHYRLHMIRHVSRAPLKCDECPFKCRNWIRMLSHLRVHTGEKKIICKICGDYYYPFEVSQHMRKCPKPKPYNCVECEYSTGRKCYLERHIRLHTGERLKCSRCEEGFLDNMERKKHYKKHVKEKPYQCHICHKKFKRRENRERHILAYCDKKCPKCEYISIYCTDFYEHVKAVHPFTKLKLKLQRMYREYEYWMAKQFRMHGPHAVYRYGPTWTDPEFVATKLDPEQEDSMYKSEQSDCEVGLNTKSELVQGANDCERRLDWESVEKIDCGLLPSIKCSTECEQDAGYGLMGDVKGELGADSNAEWMENIGYELMQNVRCELTEDADNYTLLSL